MSDTPKKTLTLTRKPANIDQTSTPRPMTLNRGGKRVIRVDPTIKTNSHGKPTDKPHQDKKKPTRKTTPKKPVVRPSDLKAKELNDRLNGFPVWLNFLPLAIGIEKDIFRLVNAEHFPGASKQVVQKVLRMHTSHQRYLEKLATGGERHQLDGEVKGEITKEQRHSALIENLPRGK